MNILKLKNTGYKIIVTMNIKNSGKGEIISIMSKDDKPKPRRALVLQGGGSLGAYEAGVFKAIYEHLIEEEEENPEKNLFDIVAGTSIGAINAAILVSYVKENKYLQIDLLLFSR